MKYHIQKKDDGFVRELQDEVYNINQSVYTWFENYSETFKKILNPNNLFNMIDFNNLRKLPEEYWIDIIRAIMVLTGFGCKKVYAFGSLVRGETNKNSDLDLAVEGCPVGRYLKMYGKVINITEHKVDIINLDKAQDKFVKYLKSRKEGELISVTKGRSSD